MRACKRPFRKRPALIAFSLRGSWPFFQPLYVLDSDTSGLESIPSTEILQCNKSIFVRILPKGCLTQHGWHIEPTLKAQGEGFSSILWYLKDVVHTISNPNRYAFRYTRYYISKLYLLSYITIHNYIDSKHIISPQKMLPILMY